MKNKKETIAKGIISLLFSQVLIKIVGLAYKLYLTNKDGFGDKGNAIYSSGFQIYALLLTFSSTGVPNAIAKLVSERVAIGDNRGAHRIFKIAFFTFALFGLIGTILLFVGAETIATKWLEIPEAKYCLVMLSPSIFFVSITSVMRGYFNGKQNLSVMARSQTIEQICKTIFTILFVEIIANISNNNTVLMAGIANFATTIATGFSFFYIYVYYRSRRKEIAQDISQSINYIPTRVRKTLKKILKESIPISITALMSSFNKNIDLFTIVRILKKYISENEAKIQYGMLSGKIDTLCLLPISLNVPFVTGMVPSIAKSIARNDMEQLEKKINIFLKITILIAFPSTVGLIIFAKPILVLLFPNASDGDILLKINSISVFFSLISQTINGILQGIGKNRIPMFAFFVGMIFKFFSNIILIKYMGINGAAIGNIVCNFVVCIIVCFELRKYIKIKVNLNELIFKPILATFIMGISSSYLFFTLNRIISYKMATILAISISVAIYSILVFFWKLLKVAK